MGKFLHNRQVCASGNGALSSVCVDYANAVSQGERSHEGGHHHIPTPKADNSTQSNCWAFLHRNGEYDNASPVEIQARSTPVSPHTTGPQLTWSLWGATSPHYHLTCVCSHPAHWTCNASLCWFHRIFFLFKNHRMQKRLTSDIIRRLNIEMNQPVTPGPWLGTNYTDR